MPTKIRTIFMGTPDFSAVTLESLINSDFIEVIAVICNQDKPIGRNKILTPPPTKILAQKHNIPVLQPDKIREPEWVDKIKELNPELIIVSAFGQIIPSAILDIPKFKTINVHGSMLPILRGASPIQSAILEGYGKTGVSIMVVDEFMDHGAILSQEETEISPKETSETLHPKMAKLGADLLIKTLPLWLSGSLKAVEQNHEEATLTKILKKEDGKIIWADNANKIERQVRAFYPWPGTFCVFKDQDGIEKRLKIIEADVAASEENLDKPYGFLFADSQGGLVVRAGGGCLKLTRVQPEGKTIMNTAEFANGYSYLMGQILG